MRYNYIANKILKIQYGIVLRKFMWLKNYRTVRFLETLEVIKKILYSRSLQRKANDN